MNTKTKEITLIGLMAAVTCIAGPLSLALPFSPVPISLTNLAIYVSVYILGMRRGTISYLVYLLLGLVGLPVFSAFTSGPAKLFGPTGGYLTGFIFMALISGYCIDIRFRDGVACVSGGYGPGRGTCRGRISVYRGRSRQDGTHTARRTAGACAAAESGAELERVYIFLDTADISEYTIINTQRFRTGLCTMPQNPQKAWLRAGS